MNEHEGQPRPADAEAPDDDSGKDRRRFLGLAGAGVVGGALAATMVGTEAADAVEGPDYITVDSLPAADVLAADALIHAVQGGESYQVPAGRLVNEVGDTVAAITSGDLTTWGSAPIGKATDVVFAISGGTTPHVLVLPSVATPVIGRPAPLVRIHHLGTRPLVVRAGSGAVANARADAEPGGGFRSAGQFAVIEARMLMNIDFGGGPTSVWSVWGDLERTGS